MGKLLEWAARYEGSQQWISSCILKQPEWELGSNHVILSDRRRKVLQIQMSPGNLTKAQYAVWKVRRTFVSLGVPSHYLINTSLLMLIIEFCLL